MNQEDLKIFARIPTIKTERLTLRKIMPSDLFDVYDYAKQKEVSKYLLWYPHPDIGYTRQYLSFIMKRYKKYQFYDWAVVFENKMIGTAGFTSFDLNNNSCEIGYVLNKDYWGKQIAKEAAEAVIKFGFEVLDLQRISAKYIIGNDKSRKVMEKCHMNFEGMMRSAVLCKNKYMDVGICAITKEEYIQYQLEN